MKLEIHSSQNKSSTEDSKKSGQNLPVFGEEESTGLSRQS
jgi:hypothetical protein